MATITFAPNVSPNNAFLNIPTEIDSVVARKSTTFEVGDPRFTVLRLEGTGFSYSGSGAPTAGTLTGFTLRQGGVPTVTVTGLPPLLTLTQAEALRLTGAPGALLRYLLAGNDQAFGGDGDQTILTEGGNDTIDGGAGADYIIAGDGDDFVISGLGQGPSGGAAERLIGGAGVDRLIIDRSDRALAFVFDVMVENVTTMLDGTHLSGFEQMQFRSGSGNDELAGGALADVIMSGAGNDRVSGRGGDDTLSAGDGADDVDGGAGNDSIAGEDGLDNLAGGDGNDTIHGGGQSDNLYGGNSSDFLSGGSGADNIDGGSDADLIYGDSGADILAGASGNDLLDGGSEADNIDGGSDDDLIYGDSGADILAGASGNDLLDGGGEADYLSGGDGNDILSGGAGADQIEGGSGADVLDGGSGPDSLLGNLGDDLYFVDNPNDVLFDGFGEGYDTVNAFTSFTLTASASIELLRTANPLSKAALDLKGNGFDNSIEGNAGSNTLNGLTGADVLKGGKGHDTFVFNTKLSKKNIDKILDFRVKDDSILLSRTIFKKLTFEEKGKHKILSEGSFCKGAKAQDADDRIIYNNRSGRLYYDEDGTGDIKPILFAKLAKGLKLTEADFWV